MTKHITIFKKTIYILCAITIFQNLSFAQDIYEITAKNVTYNDNKNTVVAEGDAVAVNSSGKKVSSDKILYYKNQNIIETFGSSKFEDEKIILTANNFKYDIEIKTIEAIENVVLVDEGKNKYLFSFFKYLENEERGFGENMKAYLNDGSYLESETGQTNNKTEITKLNQAKYTTCSNIIDKNNQFCPTWSIKSNSTTHNKKEKKIIHRNAFLRIKNIPILYSPYLSHPDPSVKRQSGFLPPLIKTISDIGKTIKTPYFWAISDDKDITFTPIYSFEEKNSILTSYRQAFKNSFLNIESGYSGGYKKIDQPGRTNGSRNYLFLDYKKVKKNLLFSNNEINLKLQRISQENFTRVNKINTELFKEDLRNLENSIKINSYDSNKRLELRAGIFENLDTKDSSKYTYYLPDGIFSYNVNNFKNLNLNFNSYFLGSKFSKDEKQLKIRNLLSIDSKPLINNNTGISTSLKSSIYNKNIYNDNVSNSKDNENIDNYMTVAVDTSLPLGKFDKENYKTLTPRAFIKYTTGNQLDASQNSKIFNFSDVFSLNRTNDLDLPETGFSIGHGLDYSFVSKEKTDNKINKKMNYVPKFKSSMGIGQVLRTNKSEKMPNTSSLDNKSSDFAGYFKLTNFGETKDLPLKNTEKISFINDFHRNGLSIDYDFNLSNDLEQFNRNNLEISGTLNKLNFSSNFDEKNNNIGNDRSASVKLMGMLNNNYYIELDGKRNLKSDSSEYQNLSLNFEDDCLNAALTLSKQYYNDQDISNSKTLIFSIIIKPFSDDFAPDLSNFIN